MNDLEKENKLIQSAVSGITTLFKKKNMMQLTSGRDAQLISDAKDVKE